MKIHIINSDQFYPEWYPYAERIACGNAGVEDIVQECMIGLWDSENFIENMEGKAQ